MRTNVNNTILETIWKVRQVRSPFLKLFSSTEIENILFQINRASITKATFNLIANKSFIK